MHPDKIFWVSVRYRSFFLLFIIRTDIFHRAKRYRNRSKFSNLLLLEKENKEMVSILIRLNFVLLDSVVKIDRIRVK